MQRDLIEYNVKQNKYLGRNVSYRRILPVFSTAPSRIKVPGISDAVGKLTQIQRKI